MGTPSLARVRTGSGFLQEIPNDRVVISCLRASQQIAAENRSTDAIRRDRSPARGLDVEFVVNGCGLGPNIPEQIAKPAVIERASLRYALRLKFRLRDSRGLEPEL
jgi:hypothetical protein